jgi:predicted MFS family arabinose efflux permease
MCDRTPVPPADAVWGTTPDTAARGTTPPDQAARGLIAAAYAAFSAFGAFWGVWGASVPRVQARAGISVGELGFALLFVGAGALPAMLLAGRALDRWGQAVAAATIAVLGAVGAGAVVAGRGLASLCVGLTLVGAASGAADVAMNSLIGRAERLVDRPVIARAHGVFSTAVVASSLAAGAAYAVSPRPVTVFLAAAALCLLAAAYMLKRLPAQTDARRTGADRHRDRTATTDADAADAVAAAAVATIAAGSNAADADAADAVAADAVAAAGGAGRSRTGPRIGPLVLVGVLGALAFASENAHQSWAAVFAQDELHAGAGLAAVAPAVFAATVAVTRLSLGTVRAAPARTVLLAGAVASAVGAVVVAAARSFPVAAVGLVVVGAGTAVLFPTLLSIVTRHIAESHRGRATSIVSTVSYLGFLLGPVYVGAWADHAGLRVAMLAVAAIAVALFALAPPLLRLSGFTAAPPPNAPPDTASERTEASSPDTASERAEAKADADAVRALPESAP